MVTMHIHLHLVQRTKTNMAVPGNEPNIFSVEFPHRFLVTMVKDGHTHIHTLYKHTLKGEHADVSIM